MSSQTLLPRDLSNRKNSRRKRILLYSRPSLPFHSAKRNEPAEKRLPEKFSERKIALLSEMDDLVPDSGWRES